MSAKPSPHILVADDVPLNFLFLESVLSLVPCELVCVRHGQAAVEAFVADVFDLAILDCRMPRMNGLQALRLMRIYESLRGRSRTPVLVVSASQEDRRPALEAGCDAYLEKPLDKNLLLRTLGKYLPAFQGLSVVAPLRTTAGAPALIIPDTPPAVAGFPRRGSR